LLKKTADKRTMNVHDYTLATRRNRTICGQTKMHSIWVMTFQI